MTKLPHSKWTELFGNMTMFSALVGRLTYRSHVLDMNDPSYRLMSTQGEGSARSLGSRGRRHSSLRDAYFWPMRLKHSFPLAVQILVSTWLNDSLTLIAWSKPSGRPFDAMLFMQNSMMRDQYHFFADAAPYQQRSCLHRGNTALVRCS